MLSFRRFPAAKTSMDKRRCVKYFRRKFFVSKCRKLSPGNPSVLCFRKLPVVKKIMHKKGGYKEFLSKAFCLKMSKTFAREPFCAVFQKTLGSE